MQLQLDWTEPLRLTDGSRDGLIYTCDFDSVPDGPGIYVFARRYGQRTEALYVGMANELHARIKAQLKCLPLTRYIKDAKSGARVILFGCFAAKSA